MKTEEQKHYRGRRLGPSPCLDGGEGSNFQLDSLGAGDTVHVKVKEKQLFGEREGEQCLAMVSLRYL